MLRPAIFTWILDHVVIRLQLPIMYVHNMCMFLYTTHLQTLMYLISILFLIFQLISET